MLNKPSPFLLIFRGSASARGEALPPEQRQLLLSKWNNWYDSLTAQGKLLDGHPLEAQGRVLSGGMAGQVIDGPFAESKEAIAGYFFLSVSDLEEATQIARQCPSLQYGGAVEIRPVAARPV